MPPFFFINEGIMNRTEIIEQLKNGPMIVTFEKKDGTIRKMKCTLKSDLLTEYEKKTDRESKPNLDIVPVYDLEKESWRSFRVDSVQTITSV